MGSNEGQTSIYKGSDSNVTWVDDLNPDLGKLNWNLKIKTRREPGIEFKYGKSLNLSHTMSDLGYTGDRTIN